MEYNYLQHAGTKGMKWGKRLYQNPDGSLTALGRARYRKMQKQRRKNLEKAREIKKTKAEAEKEAAAKKQAYDDAKQKALKSGSAADILKFKGDLTNQELQTAISRLNYEKSLSDVAASQAPKKGLAKVTALMDKFDNLSKTAETGVGAYNRIAGLVGLPKIGGKGEAAKAAMEKFINTASLEDIQKNFGKYSQSDMAAITNRLKFEDEIKGKINTKKQDEEKAAQAKKEAEAKAAQAKKVAADNPSDKNAKKEAKQAEKEAKQAKKEAEQAKKETKQAEKEAKRAKKETEQATKESKEQYDDYINGDDYVDNIIDWSNTSSKSNSKTYSSYKSSGKQYVDAVWEDMGTVDDTVSNDRWLSAGQSYVAGLLSSPKDRD